MKIDVSSFPPRIKLAILSDVSVGYGTPQILRMAESFARIFCAEVHIFEPDQSERPPIAIRDHIDLPHVHLTRIYTTAHPFTMEARIEFMKQVADRLCMLHPEILICSSIHRLPILEKIPNWERVEIFYCLEEIDSHYDYLFPLVQDCKIIIFPEENRRRIYLERLGMSLLPNDNLVVLNANHPRTARHNGKRQGRIFYGGSFHKDITYADYFLKPEILKLPVDIYGIVDGYADSAAIIKQLNGKQGGAHFRGYMQSDAAFFDLLSSYLYSIVIWNPDREDRYYAAPNKFFDAVASGVPPICAPHPQCVELVKKWNCGILMDDWSFNSFKKTLERALKAADSDYYLELVANCQHAMEYELSWDRQFEKLIPVVSKHLTRLGHNA